MKFIVYNVIILLFFQNYGEFLFGLKLVKWYCVLGYYIPQNVIFSVSKKLSTFLSGPELISLIWLHTIDVV